mmetsp:Transcript_14688/g.22004  ORF Transcript_14688/g.22004 Transcript_14688/m.22004 type:complete len:85 (-) Transcript_14688:288-542(-)
MLGPNNKLPLGDIADEESLVFDVVVPLLPVFSVGKDASSKPAWPLLSGTGLVAIVGVGAGLNAKVPRGAGGGFDEATSAPLALI